jgi:hypothetical protein
LPAASRNFDASFSRIRKGIARSYPNVKVDRDKVGQQRLIDYDRVAGIVGSKDQCAGSMFTQVLRHNEEVVRCPCNRGYADVVAQFAGPPAGGLFQK